MGVDAIARYAVELINKVSGPADEASAAVERLQKEVSSGTKELNAMNKALRLLELAANPNKKQIDDLKQRIEKQREAVAKAQGKIVDFGGAIGRQTKLAQFSKSMKDMPGPVHGFTESLVKVQQILGGGVMRAGLLGTVAALGALAVATAYATHRLYEYGVAQASARGEELARLGGIRDMQNALDRVAARVPASRSALESYAATLQKAGLEGAEFESALEAVGLKLSVGKKGSADTFVELVKNTKAAHRSVTDLAGAVQTELGGKAADAMQSLTVQAAKQKEAFDSLFGGVEIKQYEASWKSVNDLLTQNTASGRALKQVIADLIQPMVDQSTAAAPIVKRFFQGVLLGILELQIAFLQLQVWWYETFGASDAKKAVDDSKWWIVDLGRVIAKVFVPLLIVAAGAVFLLALRLTASLVPALFRATFAMLRFGLMAIPNTLRAVGYLIGRMLPLIFRFVSFVPAAWAAVAPLLPFAAAILGVVAAVGMLVLLWDELKKAWDQFEWAQLGKDIMSGIVKGLTGEWGSLAASIAQIGTDAWKVFKGAIGASSPSKLFAEAGLTIPQGVALGIETGSPEVQQAAESMVSVPTVDVPALGADAAAAGGPQAGAPAAAGAAGGVHVEIGQVVVNAASSDPRQLASDFRRELENVLEGLALQLGARVSGGVPA